MIEPAATAPARQVWTVGALLLAASDALSARFGAVSVRGELSGFTRAASGHCYFSLKDAGGQGGLLRCAMFRRAAALIDFPAADGQQVELRGRLAIYEARGELQMVVESMQRVGAGTLFEEFLRLRARLQAEGLFDADRKRGPPPHPATVGIVTSAGGAALHDVLTSFARRAPHLRLVLYPTLVQGAQAPAAIVQALQSAALRREVDTLLLVRGGGSLEDLWAFNDERVVRAVVAMPMPVICGVGHETDLTLADLAADLRAATPTAAAELACVARADTLALLQDRADRAATALRRRLESQAQRLDTLALRLGRPARALAGHRQTLERLMQRLSRAASRRVERQHDALPRLALRLQRAVAVRLEREQAALAARADRLHALDPKGVLGRGFAWIEDGQGRAVTSARALQVGDRVQAVWADGRAGADIVEVAPEG